MDSNDAGRQVKVVILNSLRDEILKRLKGDAPKVYDLIEQLTRNHHKGKVIGHAGGCSIRELKYNSFRLYYIISLHKLILFDAGALRELLVEFIAMSKKHDQQHVINQITTMLESLDDSS